MALLKKSQSRAQSARTNGAKSTGASTEQGKIKARLASLKHGIYATEETLKATIDPKEFANLYESFLEVWQPENTYIAKRLESLTRLHFALDRLTLVRSILLNDRCDSVADVIGFEISVSEQGSVLDRMDLRVRRYEMDISRLERDIIRLKKEARQAGPSQELLKTNEEPETAPEADAAQHATEPSEQPKAPALTVNKAEFPPPAAEIRPVM